MKDSEFSLKQYVLKIKKSYFTWYILLASVRTTKKKPEYQLNKAINLCFFL